MRIHSSIRASSWERLGTIGDFRYVMLHSVLVKGQVVGGCVEGEMLLRLGCSRKHLREITPVLVLVLVLVLLVLLLVVVVLLLALLLVLHRWVGLSVLWCCR